MIKVDEIEKIEKYDGGKRYVKVSLTADTKAEVLEMGTDGSLVKGLLDMDVIAAHSTAFTADKKLLVLDSAGVWH